MACRAKQSTPVSPRLNISALVLAAGSGSRMGFRPKCLLHREGIALIRHLISALACSGIDRSTVVLGHYADLVAHELLGLPTTPVLNPDPDAGQISSLRLGLAALPAGTDAVIVALADQPLIGSREIIDLVCAYKNRPPGTRVVQPSIDGLPGNPVMFSTSVADEILQSGTHVGCRQWQAVHPAEVYSWPSDNVNYRLDIDSQADIDNISRHSGYRFQWPSTSGPMQPHVTRP